MEKLKPKRNDELSFEDGLVEDSIVRCLACGFTVVDESHICMNCLPVPAGDAVTVYDYIANDDGRKLEYGFILMNYEET